MIHIKRDRCGYAGYICQGLSYPSDSISICADDTVYDKNAGRKNFHNYLNLPPLFLGVINDTPYNDLSSNSAFDITQCIYKYKPFELGGLIDWFKYVKTNSDFIMNSGDYTAHMQQYISNTTEYPGILSPRASLSNFNIAPTIIVPTEAITSASSQSSGSLKKLSSGCRLLCVLAKRVGVYKVKINVSSGKLLLSNNSLLKPVTAWLEPILGYVIEGKLLVDKILVHAAATWNFKDSKWNIYECFLHNKTGQYYDFLKLSWSVPKTVSSGVFTLTDFNFSWAKTAELATIKYEGGLCDVIQVQCSPVDMRDWVSELSLLKGDKDGSLFVFSYRAGSTKKGWLKVKDC